MKNIYTATGKKLDSITLNEVMKGNINYEDIKISKNSLEEQAEIAIKNGNIQQAENFQRAAEMLEFTDSEVLEMYNQLRPNRSSEAELLKLIEKLKSKKAYKCAELAADSLSVYKKRGILIK